MQGFMFWVLFISCFNLLEFGRSFYKICLIKMFLYCSWKWRTVEDGHSSALIRFREVNGSSAGLFDFAFTLMTQVPRVGSRSEILRWRHASGLSIWVLCPTFVTRNQSIIAKPIVACAGIMRSMRMIIVPRPSIVQH